MSTPYVMRPARLDDYDALMAMAVESGPGFTSLPVDEQIIRGRLEKSVASFAGQIEQLEYGKYLMMLENTETGEVGGCSAVKAGTGIDAPFFNYRIITLAQASLAADRRFDMDALVLTNEFVGFTEVGTLFVREGHRGNGIGRLTAQSRYLLMATQPDRFGDMVLAELRGVVDKDGQTPFWEHLGRHFFRMDFTEADYLSATTNNQFILDLMPKYPVYVDLLPPEAREVIGRCHADGVGAMKLLEWEGFRFERVVDIFDGGPMVVAQRELIRTIREARTVTLEAGEATGQTGLVARCDLENYRATQFDGALHGEDRLITSPEILDRLQLKSGEQARIWLRT
ncbi:arginine N-succinyltransferase [Hyphomonas sp. FCG-A18]|uniref:arginine N-succinyltransferase n=1 Tax=Hyphomonas sp. FCG-A18 TaxID=3080019 RepID=UPI002B2CC378|nr:arginine N-succinyltransferase [Hyphomonas sp. FCG-A18]